MHVLIDALVLALSYVLSWYCYVRLGVMNNHPERGILPPATYMMALLYIVPGYLLLYYAFNLYASKRFQGRRLEFANILKANTVGFLVWLASLYMVRQVHFSRGMLCIFFVLNVTLETIVRNLIHYILSNMWKHGRNQKQILMVGYSRATEEYIDRIIANPEWGYLVRGIIDDHVKAGTMYRGIKVLGRINNLSVILPENKLDEIAVTLALQDYDRLEEIVNLCEKSGVHTKFIPDYNSLIPGKPYTEDLGGLPVINIRYVPLSNTLNAVAKRAVDIVGSLCGLIVTSPLLLIVAILIRATSKGPIIFSQERIGQHNHAFKMYKFRSMYMDAEERKKELMEKNNIKDGLMFKMDDDPRIIKGIGHFIRKTSLDEFPQFWNVLKGDMSLVGTRPPTVDEFKQYESHQKRRLSAKPGITGLWQVSGRNEITDFEDVVKLDVQYIDNWSLGLDIKIILKTIKVVFEKGGE